MERPFRFLRQLQAERPFGEKLCRHQFQIAGNDEREFRLIENLGLEIDTRCNLGQHDAFRAQDHDAALGDIGDVLPLFDSTAAGKGDVLDFVDQFLQLAFLLDDKLAILHMHLRTGIEHAGEDDLAGPRGDIDETAGTCRHMRAEAELGHVDRAGFVDLQEGQ